ncbi:MULTISPECIES: hypothetical protein [unclassified Chryseobacterium]|uniref:hypothetical protein n=1 Tax=unclassified Chryseobacterium TaxID=2593645 RepID=UPI001DE67BA7|nr:MULTISPECIES: hypothetical protein [unclassified Chryseobacterium]MCQ9635171.1 hypothetical protein [Chryseobacterium sp. WG23]CAH0138644.1 hypothetical protein SRABI04_00482 [Chryseobacterium sp. Bi04]
MDNFIVLTKSFAANESTVVDIKSLGFGTALNSLVFQNKTGQSATFVWQKNVMPDNAEKIGYFKEIINELGVRIAHYDGFITVTNGGGVQYLKAELKR